MQEVSVLFNYVMGQYILDNIINYSYASIILIPVCTVLANGI